MNYKTARFMGLILVAGALAGLAAHAETAPPALRSLTVCADPGDIPLSSRQGKEFENEIPEVVGKALRTGVQYYWRPSIERGLMRTTLSEGNCDLWMDVATRTNGGRRGAVEALVPIHLRARLSKRQGPAHKGSGRSGIEAASRRVPESDREALANHGVVNNTVIHYLSHNADEQADNQPSYQVQQVIDGTLDVASIK